MRASTFYHMLTLLLRKNAQASTWQFDFSLSTFKIRLVFFRERFYVHFTQAFKHLQVIDGRAPDFTIYVGDHFSSAFPLKLPTDTSLTLQTRGEILALSDEHMMTHYNHHDGSLNVVHIKDNIAIYWVRGLRYVPWWTAASPIQRIIACWFRHNQHELTHAAAVGDNHHSVIFAGKSGTGKSTTTLACMASGLNYLSEDYCLIQNEPKPMVYNVYNTLKLEEKTFQFFPQLQPWVSNKNKKTHEKSLIFQSETFPYSFKKALPIQAIFVLEQSMCKETTYVSCSKAEALLALSASTILQLSWSYQSTVNFYAQLLHKVPSYKLLLGTDLTHVAACVTAFMKDYAR